MYREFPKKRYRKTLEILKKYAKEQDVILDLGVENPFSKIMKDHGWQVINTTGQDLDLNYIWAENQRFDFVTALEIIEHLVNPFSFKEFTYRKSPYYGSSSPVVFSLLSQHKRPKGLPLSRI